MEASVSNKFNDETFTEISCITSKLLHPVLTLHKVEQNARTCINYFWHTLSKALDEIICEFMKWIIIHFC